MYRWGPPLPPTFDLTLDSRSLNLPFPILYSFSSDLVSKLLI